MYKNILVDHWTWMRTDSTQTSFLEASEEWLCDGYSLDIRFIAGIQEGKAHIWDALIGLDPLPATSDHDFRIETQHLLVGRESRSSETKVSLIRFLERAISGSIGLKDRTLGLNANKALSYYSETINRDQWFNALHLSVQSEERSPTSPDQLSSLDNALRRASRPFDGLPDVAAWLGLRAPGTGSNTGITIRILPPADLILDRCSLANDSLRVVLHTAPLFDVRDTGVAIRAVPGDGFGTRVQIADAFVWREPTDGRREGVANVTLRNADAALLMLSIGSTTVRRHWIVDPAKARNNRLLAVHHFDKDLRKIRSAVLESTDKEQFENGIAALLFLLGFSPSVQIETDAPDVVATTNNGRLILIECTTRVADFATKLGKLVDRRGGLTKALEASGHPADVTAVLLCRLPKDQIVRLQEARDARVIVLTKEDLEAALLRARVSNDADQMLRDAEAQLTSMTRALNS